MSRLTFLLLLALGLSAATFQGWEQNPQLPETAPWAAVLPHPLENQKVLAAARNKIYENTPGGREAWKKVTALSSPGLEIKRLRYLPQFPDFVFALTQRQLFKISLKTETQERLYELPRLKDSLTDFSADPSRSGRFFLGTSAGVLESEDAGRSWHSFAPISKEPVCFLRFAAKRFFVAQNDKLLVSENLAGFEKSFSLSHFKEEEPLTALADISRPEDESQTAADACFLRDLVSNRDESKFWLATSRGVFENTPSQNLSWSEMPAAGLTSKDIRFLIQDEQNRFLFAAGLRQIFQFTFSSGSWREIPLALSGGKIRGISADSKQLNVIADSGLLTYPLLPDHIQTAPVTIVNPQQRERFQRLIQLEPSAVQVQRAVSRFANTRNSKTKLWQAESRLRAFFPTVSFGKDFSRHNNVDLDRGGTSDPDKFIQGPEDKAKSWDVRVAWDLGDFIFSSNQTSIDSREKLMVELRHDLTSEATRLYYERRRLQAEFFFLPADSEEEHLERELRIEELTALLDSLTNGFFSKRLEAVYEKEPELRELWSADKMEAPVTRHLSPSDKVTMSQGKED